jgi:hypothetical protein
MIVKESAMLKFVLTAVTATSLMMPAANAQYMQAAPTEPPKAAKPLSPKQQKAKDCRAQWKEAKKTSNVKGRAAYQNFMKSCTASRTA